MSHFSVLVVVDEPVNDDTLMKALQPFHEFECTGTDDEHVTDVVEDAAEYRAEYEKRTSEQQSMSFHDWLHWWTDRPILEGTGPRPKNDRYKYGFIRVVNGAFVEIVDRTNPNRKWDWWTVGGRWPNKLILKSGGKADDANASDVNWDATNGLGGPFVFALLHGGAWFEKGAMGWWGASTATPSSTVEFLERLNEVIRSLTDKHHVYVVDCHI